MSSEGFAALTLGQTLAGGPGIGNGFGCFGDMRLELGAAVGGLCRLFVESVGVKRKVAPLVP